MRDYNIRLHIKDSILKPYLTDRHSKVVEELNLPVAKARVDVAVINGHLHGFEIKSASDTLKRLPKQMDAYEKVFDYVSVITEDKYLKKVLAVIPEWVGVYLCTDRAEEVSVTEVRPACFNNRKQGFFIAKLLWHSELIEVLSAFQVPHKRRDRVWTLCDSAATHIDVETLSLAVREKLKSRVYWKGDL